MLWDFLETMATIKLMDYSKKRKAQKTTEQKFEIARQWAREHNAPPYDLQNKMIVAEGNEGVKFIDRIVDKETDPEEWQRIRNLYVYCDTERGLLECRKIYPYTNVKRDIALYLYFKKLGYEYYNRSRCIWEKAPNNGIFIW